MADLERTVRVLFEAKDNLAGKLIDMEKSVEGFTDKVESISDPFAEATKKVGALILAIGGIVAAGTKASSDLETQGEKMRLALGLPIAEAERFEAVAKTVYKAGFADDLATAFDGVILAQRIFGANASTDIGKVTNEALKIQRIFGVDMEATMGAAGQLMNAFGVDSTTAFGFVVKGMQEGLDNSGDFLDSIKEYAPQFASSEADIAQFFSVLDTGFAGGIMGTDKAADALKEFRLRITDDSKQTAEALGLIGLDNVKLQANIQSGETTIIEAFDLVITKLKETDSKTARTQAGFGLLGSPFEDLGDAAALNINIANTSIGDLQTALDKFDPSDFATRMQSAWNTITTDLADHKEWDKVKESVQDLFEGIAASVGPALANVDFTEIEEGFAAVWGAVQKIFSENKLDLTSVEGMTHALQLSVDAVGKILSVAEGILDVFAPIVSTLIDLFESFSTLDNDTTHLAGQILGVGTAINILAQGVAPSGKLLGGLGKLLKLVGVNALPLGMAGVSLAAGVMAGKLIALIPGVNDLVFKFAELTDKVFNWTGTQGTNQWEFYTDEAVVQILAAEAAIVKMDKEIAETDRELEVLALIHTELLTGEKLSKEIGPVNLEAQADLDALNAELAKAGVLVVPTSIDGTGAENGLTFLMEEVGRRADGSPILMRVNVDTNEATGKLNDLEKKVPSDKIIAIQIQGEIDKELALIKGGLATVQTAMEWKAKIDIAEAEAAAKVIVSAFESVNVGIDSTGDLIGSLFGDIKDSRSIMEKWNIEKQIAKENELRERSFNLQEKLIDSQIKYMDAKAKALAKGDIALTVSAEGITPALEMIFHEILRMAQLEANAEGLDLLLGA